MFLGEESTTLIIPFIVCVVLIHVTHTISPNLKIHEVWGFYWAIWNAWLHAHLPYILKKVNVCSKVF